MIFLFVCRIPKNLALFLEFSNSKIFRPLIASADSCSFLFLYIHLLSVFPLFFHLPCVCGCVQVCLRLGCAWVCVGLSGCEPVCTGVSRCAQVCTGMRECEWVWASVHGCAWVCVGMHGCAQMCVGVRGCVQVCAEVCGCLQVYMWDEFSEYLLETRVLTSADLKNILYKYYLYFRSSL